MLFNSNLILIHSDVNYIYKKPSYFFFPDKITSDLFNFNSSGFTSFFKLSNVTIPQVLNNTNSINRLKNLNTLNVFPKYLARHGMKERSRKLVLTSMINYYNSIGNSCTLSWKILFLNLSTLFRYNCNSNISFFNFNIASNPKKLSLKSILTTSFTAINLMFSFYIYKVDKHIYKNSRGRSGKFTFIWKYIAPYKRVSRITYWLLKDVKTTLGKTLKERLLTTLKNFLDNPQNSLPWKIKKFSLNYGYYNLRRSLLETYKTSSR